MGEYLGVDKRTVRGWERGEAGIPDEYMGRLCDLFRVPLDHLLGREPARLDADTCGAVQRVLERAVADVDAWLTDLPATCDDLRMGLLSLRRDIAAAAGEVPMVRVVR
jgi:transcriptional regulator with XRE-family HTH domain